MSKPDRLAQFRAAMCNISLGVGSLALVACGGGGGGGDDPSTSIPNPIPSQPLIPSDVNGTYALNSDAISTTCSDGSAASGEPLSYYMGAELIGNVVSFSRGVEVQFPGFSVVTGTPISGEIKTDRSFSATGYTIIAAPDLGQIKADYFMEGAFVDAGWAGTLRYTMQMPNGVSCETITQFDGGKRTTEQIGGIWSGYATSSGGEVNEVVGLSTEEGEGRFITSDSEQTVGTFTVENTQFRASIVGYAPFGYYYSDGTTMQFGSASGTLAPKSGIQASVYSEGALLSNINLDYENIYERDSSLSSIAGTYEFTDNVAGYSIGFVIDQVGSISGGSTDGCSLIGNASTIDTSYNMYRLVITIGSCQQYVGTYTGLAVLSDRGGSLNDTLISSVSGPQWVLSHMFQRSAVAPPEPTPPEPTPPEPTPPEPVPPEPTPTAFGDADEDGNTWFDSAALIASEAVITDSVSSSSDGDFFVFTAAETGTYSLALEFTTPDMYLYWYNDDDNRTLVGESRISGLTSQVIGSRYLQAGQVYYIGVQAVNQTGPQDYKLTLVKD